MITLPFEVAAWLIAFISGIIWVFRHDNRTNGIAVSDRDFAMLFYIIAMVILTLVLVIIYLLRI